MEKRKVEDILDKLNIPIDNFGYKYLISALEIYQKDINTKITLVYRQVAKRNNSTSSRVERAIRHCISSNEEEIKKFFNVNYDITNKRFIALLNREVERRKWNVIEI